MMKNGKKWKTKRALWLPACLVVLAVASGCGSDQNGSGTGAGPAYNQNGGGTQTGNSESGQNAAKAGGSTGLTEPDKAAPDQTRAETKKGEGSYVGQVDTHSVEIKTDRGAVVFQIDDEIAEQLAGIAEDAPIDYEYIEKEVDGEGEKVTQLWLTKIETRKGS